MDEKLQCSKCGIWLRRNETHSCQSGGLHTPWISYDAIKLISKTLQENQLVFDKSGCDIFAEIIFDELLKGKFIK